MSVPSLKWQKLDYKNITQLLISPCYKPFYANISPHNLINWFPNEYPSYIAKSDNLTFVKTLDVSEYKYITWLIGNKIDKSILENVLNEEGALYLPDYIYKLVDYDLIKNYKVESDSKNNEYVCSTIELSSLTGSEYSKIRKIVNKYEKNRENVNIHYYYNILALSSNVPWDEIKLLYNKWSSGKKIISRIYDDERDSLYNMLYSTNTDKLGTKYIFQLIRNNENKLISIWVGEIINSDYITVYYTFYDYDYKDISYYSYHKYAKEAASKGILKMNVEQDLGLGGLQAFKQGLRPVSYQSVYKVLKV